VVGGVDLGSWGGGGGVGGCERRRQGGEQEKDARRSNPGTHRELLLPEQRFAGDMPARGLYGPRCRARQERSQALGVIPSG
jgi:hypothetical protein